MLAKDGRLVSIVLELKIVRRVFEKECPVLNTSPGIVETRLLVKGETIRTCKVG